MSKRVRVVADVLTLWTAFMSASEHDEIPKSVSRTGLQFGTLNAESEADNPNWLSQGNIDLPLSTTELTRYSRHLALSEVGISGQGRIKSSRVLLIGAGGLGSPAALYLAACGIGTLGIADCDRVELSNLQRQVLFDTDDLSRTKTSAAKERLSALNSDINVVTHDVEVCASNVLELIADYDIVLDGSDRLGTRYVVNDACVMAHKSLITAAIHRFEGQVMTYVPGRGPCYRCLFPEVSETEIPNCATAGVLGVLPGVIGSLQATEAIKLILAVGQPLVGRLLVYDALQLRFRELLFDRRSDCAVCGDHPSITGPFDLPPNALSQTGPMPANAKILTPHAVQSLLDAAEPLLVIDVREPHEFGTGHIDRAINVPLGELEEWLAQTPANMRLLFVSRSGARSRRACGMAAQLGFYNLAHLDGGLLAWVQQFDESMHLS